MQIYRGVVRAGVVVLPEDAHLAEGTPVEVRVLHALMNGVSEEEAERAFERELLALGILSSLPAPLSSPRDNDFEPIEIQGKPLSKTIIRERGW